MAFVEMGVRYCGAIADSTWQLVFHRSSLRVFHKVDQGQSTGENHVGYLNKFHVAKNHLSFQGPSYITVDNGKQFDCTEFRNFYSELGIKLAFASVNHQESNGAVKRANDLIFNSVPKALFNFPKGKWAQELITSV